jgi:hypothetical protein
MVHALEQTWRVLRVGGWLLDLRPLGTAWLLEVVGRGTRILVGHLDDGRGIEDDVASDVAIAGAVRRGWFEKEQETFLEYNYCWDTVDGMNAFIEEEWDDLAVVPNNVLADAHRLMPQAGEDAQIRVRRTMLLASYRRLAG